MKFWFAHSLGDLPVYPPWALLDAVARVLEEPRQWTSYKLQQQMAFILPCADTWNLTPRMKELYISRKAYSITKAGYSASAFQKLFVKFVLFFCLLLAVYAARCSIIMNAYNKHLNVSH